MFVTVNCLVILWTYMAEAEGDGGGKEADSGNTK